MIVHQLAVTWASVNLTDESTSASSGSAKNKKPVKAMSAPVGLSGRRCQAINRTR